MQRTDLKTVEKKAPLTAFYPLMQEFFARDTTFTLTISGNSMWPTLTSGRDRVTLAKPPAKWHKNDLPLYRRTNGQLVLHRIVRVNADGTLDCCGDHQREVECGLRPEQMVAIAVGLERKGKTFPANHRGYVRWVRLWTFLLPLRPLFFRLFRWKDPSFLNKHPAARG